MRGIEILEKKLKAADDGIVIGVAFDIGIL